MKKRKSSERELIAELQAYTRLAYTLLADQYDTWQQMADACDLSITTCYNIFTEVTKYPRHMTLQRISKATGLSFDTNTMKVTLKRKRVA